MTSVDPLSPPTDSPSGFEYRAGANGVAPIVGFDPVPAIDHFFRQTSHRAISLAIWLVVGRILLAAWPRNFDFTIYLLPAALGCAAIALPSAFLSVTIARHRRQCERGPWGMVLISLALAVLASGWMFIPKLVQVLKHAPVSH
jgi:hypothetical protein